MTKAWLDYLLWYLIALDEARLGSVTATFFEFTDPLPPRSIGWLLGRGVLPKALIADGDGGGLPIAAARVERVGQRFEFLEDGARAFVAVARDEDGGATDLVAWQPQAGWTAPWLGEVALLGQHEVLAPRGPDPLPIHREFLGWLRAGRNGVVLLDRTQGRQVLAETMLQAESVEHGVELRRLLMPPEPRIVVPANVIQRVAA